MDEKFKVIIPAQLEKSEDGEWKVYGLASTARKDLQGESMDLKGLDLSPIEKGRGVFNWDHKKGPEHTIGAIDSFKKTADGLYLGGYLFKNHEKAKAAYQIMTSLKKSDKGRMGMSVEGIIKQREGKDGKTIKKAVITSCALTMNPINEDTYVNLVKSFEGVEFNSDILNDNILSDMPDSTASEPSQLPEVTFSLSQVASLIKSLGVGAAYATSTPSQLTGGDAMASEDLDKDEKKEPKKDKKRKSKESFENMDKEMIKSNIKEILDCMQTLYPKASKSEIWEAVKDRLNRRFLE